MKHCWNLRAERRVEFADPQSKRLVYAQAAVCSPLDFRGSIASAEDGAVSIWFDCEYNESDESSETIFYTFSGSDNTAGFMGIVGIRKGAVSRGAILP